MDSEDGGTPGSNAGEVVSQIVVSLVLNTLPETSSLPLKIGPSQKETLVGGFNPSEKY